MSSRYYFQVGSNFELSLAELVAVFPNAEWQVISQAIVAGDFAEDFAAGEIIDQLGGTVKILRHVEELAVSTPEAVRLNLVKSFSNLDQAKITIGLAELGRDHLPKLEVSDLKADIEKSGKKVRYIEGSRYGLSAAVLLHKHVTEQVVIQTNTGCLIAQTIAIQNIDHWTLKDRGKPYANRKKGLLPPKIARIMVNLAVGSAQPTNLVLCDPFCGTGTILMEALEKGLAVIGADNDQEAVDGSIKNLQWLSTELDLPANFSVNLSDATKFQPKKQPQMIVTEPFLGKPKPKPDQIPNIFKGLSKLYLGSFKNWTKFLPNHAKVVIAFPRALAATTGLKQDYTVGKFIDNLSKLGYITHSEPILYYRPGAVIAREIRVFEYQPTN